MFALLDRVFNGTFFRHETDIRFQSLFNQLILRVLKVHQLFLN